MKKIIILILGLWGLAASGQTVGQFRYDTTKFLKVGGRNHVKIENLIQTSDSAHKPLVVGADGVIKRSTYWPGSGGGGISRAIDSTYRNAGDSGTIYRFTNATTYTILDRITKVKLPCYVKLKGTGSPASLYDSLICPIDSLTRVQLRDSLEGYIPLTGTRPGKPVSGDISYGVLDGESKKIFFQDSNGDDNSLIFGFIPGISDINGVRIGFKSSINNSNSNYYNGVGSSATGFGLVTSTTNSFLQVLDSTVILLAANSPNARGLEGTSYFGANYDSLTYVQKIYVDAKDALKVNISDTAAMLQKYKDSIAAHNIRIIGKQGLLTLTTTGSSGASTLTGSTLNIPNYAGGSSGMVDYYWQRLGVVLNATLTADGNNTYEPTVIREANPQILTSYDTVYKMWYTSGWGTYGVNYAESVDGANWTKYTSNPVVASHARSFVLKNGSTYYMYASNATAQQIDRYTSTNGITWTLATSAVISVGSVGTWNDNSVQNNFTFIEGGTWYMILEGGDNPATPSYSLGLYTSSDGITWTANGGNPVLTGLSQGGPFITKVGSTYWLWAHGGTAGSVLPTQISRYFSTNLTSWTNQGVVFPRRTADEGANSLFGQVADHFLMQRDSSVYMWYAGSTDGTAQSGRQQIKLAVINGTFAEITAGFENAGNVSSIIPENWLNVTGGINYPIGNIGIGNTAPTTKIDVSTSVNSSQTLRIVNSNTGGSAQSGFTAQNISASTTFGQTGTGYTPYGALGANNGSIYNNGPGLTLMVDNASGIIKFAAGGNTERWRMHTNGNFSNTGVTGTAGIHLKAGTATASTSPLKFTAGTNLTTPEAGAVEFDGTNYFATSSTTRFTLAKTLTNTAALDFVSTAAQTSSELTITVTGAADGDAVSLGVPNASASANSSFSARVSSVNTVTIKFNNYSSAAIDPASGTFRVAIIKY